MVIQSKNPATLEIIKIFEELSKEALENKIANAHQAYLSWRNTTFAERAKLMHAHADYIRAHCEELAMCASTEMGKTKTAALGELEKCAFTCDYYADNAERMLSNQKFDAGAKENYISFEPLGVVLAVMPWNFPYWQVYRFAAPALMAGNVGLLKHASNVPGCAEAIEKAFLQSGFPKDVFQNLFISIPLVESIIRDKRVMAVTLTGSENAGRSVAKIAGDEVKKTVLELGGSDPFIVFSDADIEAAAENAMLSRMQNNAGQSCISAKRFIVLDSVADKFTDALVSRFKKLVVGDPLLPETNVGPLATEQGLMEIERQVNTSVVKGAKILCGGQRIGKIGYFYTPTILSNVTKGMPVYDEEVFGPVAPIIVVKSEKEAIEIANDTPFGLGATIFTKDIEKAKKMASKIEAGSVFINGFVRSDPRAPFGGIKRSGYGRELSDYGIKEFVNIKNIWIG
ncbi:succinate-semialdehyde dehydrogenase [Candidatus Nomurabacteria bacterium RIFCSPHIGHO2_01_FULL_40_12]|uniref:Succinate-semialdehyde dehydrogenase n=1 Tax=Candidatus Nomurabacteria bacterium RIFCSPHIGHO2_01_FULL_40_12 TaxID=1801737 RepID=A0A1F6V210_9BACT|nr:MAG: succinate-semialdehyde dehydrogenase [Candidatus Nomurabacteria bacterium RIFCSPHIGHO2_01_FULL_40_12]